MGSNIIELAKLGHERAAELKASCGAVDVRSLAQLISDLATQLEVQFVRSTNMAVQLANAESKCRELAAENANKHEFIATCFRAAADGGSMDGADIQELGERLGLFGRETYQPILHGYICGHEAGEDTVYVMKKTPATDAFLAEVRAQGVEMLLDSLPPHYTARADIAEFAAKVRKGAAL
ncbi:TPA: hypothetical protein OP702_001593 [Salmonella enterica]|nr:hypothetical protein [Salmonella enterica]EBU7748646.1 hypothetical protein [Salmonella enterica subsp. enterica serovar Anatum]EFT3065366.1 hypothetical protein [Salmonella enterica]EHF8617471.1 hypothetical protein [Salmonella enterica]EHR7543988.1 hypothetical protein [Salmonella enterica]